MSEPTLETKLNTVFSELSTLRELMKAGFQKVENNFESVKKDLESVHKKIESAHKKIELVDKKVELVHKKIELLTTRVEALDTSTSDGFTGVGMKIESLTEEIAKIGAITGYDEQFRNMEGLKN